MKGSLSIVLRLAVAAAGIAYILYSLNWTDAVILPAGYDAPGVGALAHDARLGVERFDPATDRYTLAGQIDDRPVTLTLPAADLGTQPDTPHLRPGVGRTLAGAHVPLLIVGFVCAGLIFPIQALRWLWLMRCRGICVHWTRSLRLTLVGQFFNFCMPGMTGGDVVKAYYAAKGSKLRGEAVMSVVFDRICGLSGLVILAALVGLLMLGDPLARDATITVWILLAGMAAVGAVYFSRRLRRRLGVEWLVRKGDRFPMLRRIDETASAYRDHKGVVAASLGVSVLVHVANMAAVVAAGYALGVNQPIALMFVVLPLIFLAGAIPISYQGIGVMEAILIALLAAPGLASPNQLVGMLLIYRLYMIGYALVGSVIVARGRFHLHHAGLQDDPAQQPADAREAQTDLPRPVAVTQQG